MALPGEPTSRPLRPVAPATPSTDDWPVQATDAIVRTVDSVRDRTTGPALRAASALIYGLVLVLLAGPLFVIVLVGSMRALEHLLMYPPGLERGLEDPMWLVYLIFGTLFTTAGLVLWRKAHQGAGATT